jgi:Holliday junction resolvase
MVNTAQQGARLEREVRQMLDELGFYTARAAGSKGSAKVDVFAFHEERGSVLVQCKISNPQITPAERQGLCAVANICYAVPLVAYRKREGIRSFIRFRELTGPGPRDWRVWEPGTAEQEGDRDGQG